MDTKTAYETFRPLLHSIAYQMLGSATDAEDVVHDLFVDYEKRDLSNVHNLQAYLVKTITNRCINVLTSSRMKRETYPGVWLPEPKLDETVRSPDLIVEQQEELSYALLFLLEKLNPVERAIFILREALSYPYADIGTILEKSEANCRKIYSRAKQQLNQSTDEHLTNSPQAEALILAFLQATQSGDFDTVVGLLTEEAVLYSDGGGKVRAAMRPIYSRQRILSFLQSLAAKGLFNVEVRMTSINGQAGLLLYDNNSLRDVVLVQLNADQFRISAIYLVRNPDKLKTMTSKNSK
ncbi:RNA polymerase sigma-70 factor [Aureibacillus halotolerans]|uniref:RNA polymerase sigma-70 factor (ECF subfamily) n=1 Tax=Aureibacillus halotolerans TaxID=1508390 RepID=A0A4R6U2X5_9BACI|nr:RNA polymerase sigma-70 factor [Aureibacillus halotolerans]TDQ40788.1 RNA polymerase sigma-70 factor (ECF subfamily) [Aureibacillus halotolerans]